MALLIDLFGIYVFPHFPHFPGFIIDLPTPLSVEVIDGKLCSYTFHIRHPSLHNLMTPYFLIANVLLPTIVMVFCYIRMGISLYRSEFASKAKRHAQINLFQTCVIMMMTFTLSGTNICIYLILFVLGYYKGMSGDYYTISILLMLFNQCINPYIYCIRYKEFQAQLGKLIGYKVKHQIPETTVTRDNA